jgi:hypothetical protein
MSSVRGVKRRRAGDLPPGVRPPRLLRLPSDRRGSAGPEAVELAASAGLVLDPWQAWFLEESLAEGSDGLWSASEVGLIVPRQNGKGSVLEARQIAGLFLLGESLQVHTAHEFKTCFEHFLRVVALVENTPDLDRLVMRVRRGAGEQAIELRTGERLRFLARTGGSGRGLAAPAVYLDEAFALTPTVMGALQYTLSAQPNPQVWLTSSAPKADSAVLVNLIRRGMAADEQPRLLLAMWAAVDAVDRSDRVGWADANPGFPARITPAAIETELRQAAGMPELLVEFDRERLGQWEDEQAKKAKVLVDPVLWGSLQVPYDMAGSCALALDCDPDLLGASIGAAQVDADGTVHVEVADQRPGTDWVTARVVELTRVTGGVLLVAQGSPATALLPGLEAAGARIEVVSAADAMRAGASFLEAVGARRVAHLGEESLRLAIVGAVQRAAGDLWKFSRRSSTVDISPLVAVTLAHSRAGSVSAGPMFAVTRR